MEKKKKEKSNLVSTDYFLSLTKEIITYKKEKRKKVELHHFTGRSFLIFTLTTEVVDNDRV
jgi:hypothetical protein